MQRNTRALGNLISAAALVALAGLLLGSKPSLPPVSAADPPSVVIATVRLSEVLSQYREVSPHWPALQKQQAEASRELAALRAQILGENAKLTAEAKRQPKGVAREALLQRMTANDGRLSARQQALLAPINTAIQQELRGALDRVRVRTKAAVLLDAGAVLAGGVDVTQQVLTELRAGARQTDSKQP